MTQALTKKITLDEFIQWYPNDGKRYELHQGLVVEMPPPKGKHEKVIGFLAEKFTIEYVKSGLHYCIPKTAFVKTPFAESVYSPDVLLLNLDNLSNEPLFEKQSTICQAASAPLVVEVVSSNWQDDYYNKLGDYELMGIPEYWIADYDALGAKKFIGNPKQPTIFVCSLIDGEYEMTPFTGNSFIISPTFPKLNLTAQQVFNAAN